MAYAPAANRTAHLDEPVLRTPIGQTLRAGLVAGEVAGLCMAVAMMGVYAFALGKSPFVPFQIIGSVLLGSSAIAGMNITAFFVGFVLHQLVPSLFWGLVLAVVVILGRPSQSYTLMLVGLAVGILAQVIDVYIVVPVITAVVGVPDYWGAQVHPIASWFFHIAYGITLSIYPWKYDPVARRFA